MWLSRELREAADTILRRVVCCLFGTRRGPDSNKQESRVPFVPSNFHFNFKTTDSSLKHEQRRKRFTFISRSQKHTVIVNNRKRDGTQETKAIIRTTNSSLEEQVKRREEKIYKFPLCVFLRACRRQANRIFPVVFVYFVSRCLEHGSNRNCLCRKWIVLIAK